MLIKNGKNTPFLSCFWSWKAFNLSPLSMMLAMDFHGYPLSVWGRFFYSYLYERVLGWNSHSFYVSNEMNMYFNSFFLLIDHQYNITFVAFMLKHHGSWCIILFYVTLESSLLALYWGFNYQYIYKGYWFTVFIFIMLISLILVSV